MASSLKLSEYKSQVAALPMTGHVLSAYQHTVTNNTALTSSKPLTSTIIAYQAYNSQIAEYCVENQCLGGPPGLFNAHRTSWIKPNFTWMMYRSDWGEKDINQTNILAIELTKSFFDYLLQESVLSSWRSARDTGLYATEEDWKIALKESGVCVQWDPDHIPFTNEKLPRRTIQLGLRPSILSHMLVPNEDIIVSIRDITDFVKATKSEAIQRRDSALGASTTIPTGRYIEEDAVREDGKRDQQTGNCDPALDRLLLPNEVIYSVEDAAVRTRLLIRAVDT